MKKAVKGIIGLSAALVVLGGGLAVLKLTEPKETEESSSSASSEVSGAGITLVKDEVISSVKVTNRTDELNVIMLTAPTENSAATYTLDGYQDIALNTSVVGTLANNASGLASASMVVESCDTPEKYGFDDPEAVVEVTFESGEVTTFTIGDVSPTSSDPYVMIDGDSAVYTVSSASTANYSKTLFDFVSKTILEEPDEANYPIIKSLRIERDDMESDIYLEYDEKSADDSYTGGTSAAHIMIEPTVAYLSLDDSTPIVTGMFGLYAEDIYSIQCGEAEIAEAGLADPFCTVTMSCDDGNDYILLMSEPFVDENGNKFHYVMLEGGNVIYTVTAEDAGWGTVKPIEIASKITIGNYVWNISDMKVTGRDIEDTQFVITRKDESVDNTSLTADDFNVTKNGAVFNAERYRQFYSLLVKTPAEEFALDTAIPSEEPIVTVEYTDSYTNVVRKVEFYDFSALKALIVIDGKAEYFCSKSFAETVAENVKILDTDQELIETWS